MSDEVLCAIDGGVATVTLNRPGQRNAMNSALLAALRHRFDELDGNRDVRVVVVRGAGPASLQPDPARSYAQVLTSDGKRSRTRDQSFEDPPPPDSKTTVSAAFVGPMQWMYNLWPPTATRTSGGGLDGGVWALSRSGHPTSAITRR